MPIRALYPSPTRPGKLDSQESPRQVRARFSSAELIAAGMRAELLVFWALRRAFTGRVSKLDGHYYDWGFPMPSYLTQMLDELTEGGLLIFAEDSSGIHRLRLTDTGRSRYAQLSALGAVARPGRAAPSADAPVSSGVTVCGSVLAPVPGVRYECAQAPGHDSGPDPTPCTDAEKTISW